MKVFSRSSFALLVLTLAAAILTAPAQARGSIHGWNGHRHHVHQRIGFRHAHTYRYAGRFGGRRHIGLHTYRTRTRHASGGNASWYGSELAGHRTASGERFNPNGLTAAHRSLPFGTRVRVTNRATGRSVVVRINDRGPFVGGRSIDLARGAARAIGMGGTSNVAMAVLR